MSAYVLLLCLIQAPPAAQGEARPLPEPGGFLNEVRAHLRSDRLLLSQYTYTQKVTERQFGKKGDLKKTSVRIFEVYPSLGEGLTYRRLISKDGRPLNEQELAKQDRAYDRKAKDRARKLEREGTNEKARRLAREAEERQKEDKDIEELFQLYRISLVGREEIEGQSAVEVTFAPRPDYRPKTRDAKIIMKVAGRAWFGEKDHELIRLRIELVDTLSLGLGVLARLNKGASAVFQRRKVNNEIWLPAEARFAGTARILLLKGLRLESVSEFSDYRKFSVFTSVSFPDRRKP